MKKGLKIFLIVFAVIAVYLSCFLQIDRSFVNKKNEVNNEYVFKNVIKEESNPELRHIAMLGAHDAFSHNIYRSSKVNKNEDGPFSIGIVNFLAGGFARRVARAQVDDAKGLLEGGVRYFDVRITYLDNNYYTCHGYLSDTLESYVKPIVEYLDTHIGEFIIFDIQHFYYPDGMEKEEAFTGLFNYLDSIKNSSNKSIFDYVFYNSKVDSSIGKLTYNKITNNRNSAGVVILSKYDNPNGKSYLRSGDAGDSLDNIGIRSYWNNTNNTEELKERILQEYNRVKDVKDNDYLIVNQAQKTLLQFNKDLWRIFIYNSLIEDANLSNIEVLEMDNFNDLLKAMPIFMVDYATSSYKDFNERVNIEIRNYNKSL